MSYLRQTREVYEPRDNPRNRAIAVLERQFTDAAELRSHVDSARAAVNAPNAGSIRSLLEGMRDELDLCSRLLQERLVSLSGTSVRPKRERGHPQSFWRLFRTDGADCTAHLEALLSGYVHYARATGDSIAFLKLLGDTESVDLLERVLDAADRGIWFIELYMEGLALHMDTGHLPKFSPCIDMAAPDEANTRAR